MMPRNRFWRHAMDLREVLVRPVARDEEQQYRELMDEHHYLGNLRRISETLW